MERRLSAILAADIVGYSAQMERDESGTFARVTDRRRNIFEPEIARHQGRIFKTMGDGILAEFASVVQAVECAMSIQTALEERNRAVPGDEVIEARIGINLGEVIVDGDDRYGEGVNIAARLEGLADPGGICVSEKVAREVEKKLAFGFVPMGAQKVKNIAEPVVAYRVSSTPGPRRVPVARVRPNRALAGGILAILAAVAVAVVLWMNASPPRREGPPVLAVLPFANLTGDPDNDYLGLALPDGVLTILSSSPVLRVVSRTASLTTAPGDPPEQIAWRLGADYLLEGSVRKGGQGVQVTARLLDGRSGDQLWSGTFGGQDNDVAALQDVVARDVYVALGSAGGAVAGKIVPLAWERGSENPAEYDVFLRGAGALLTFSDTGRMDAFRIATDGTAKFPDSDLLRLLLAAIHFNRVADGASDDAIRDIDTAWSLVEQVSSRSDLTSLERWMFHYIRAIVAPYATGDLAGALEDALEAQRLVPYEPQANIDLARVAIHAGRPDLGVQWAEFYVAAQPPGSTWGTGLLAWAKLMAGRTDEALQFYESIDDPCQDCYAAALVRAGRIPEAQKVMAQMLTEWPEASVEIIRTDWTDRFPFMVEPQLSAFLDDLRKAGLPETAPPP